MYQIAEQIESTDGNTRFSYIKGNNGHKVVQEVYGFKTRNSSRKTWNRFLIIQGPLSWTEVTKQWESIKHYGC